MKRYKRFKGKNEWLFFIFAVLPIISQPLRFTSVTTPSPPICTIVGVAGGTF